MARIETIWDECTMTHKYAFDETCAKLADSSIVYIETMITDIECKLCNMTPSVIDCKILDKSRANRRVHLAELMAVQSSLGQLVKYNISF